jgi:hypothetical protein
MQELDNEVATRSEIEIADEVVFDQEAEDLPHVETASVAGRDAREQAEDQEPMLHSRHRRHARRATEKCHQGGGREGSPNEGD